MVEQGYRVADGPAREEREQTQGGEECEHQECLPEPEKRENGRRIF